MLPRFNQNKLLQQIAEAQSSTIVVKDLDHRILMANQLFADAMELECKDILGKTELELGIPGRAVLGDGNSGFPGIWALDAQAIASGETQFDATTSTRYPQDSIQNISTIRIPLCDENNEVVALLVQSPDSSELHDLKISLKKSESVREDQLSILNELMAKMMAYQELDPLLQHIAEVMVDYTMADDALILMLTESNEYIQVIASAGPRSKNNIGELRTKGKGFAGLAWSTGSTQYINNSDNNPLTKGFWGSNTQLIAVPLLVDNDVIGVAVLGAPNELDDFRTSTGLVQSLANLAGIAIASAKAQELTQLELKRTRALSEISKGISRFSESDALLSTVSKTLMNAMDLAYSSSYIVENGNNLQPIANWKKVDGAIVDANPMQEDLLRESICQWCLQNRTLARIPANTNDLRESSRVRTFRRSLSVGGTLCIPVLSKERIYAMLVIHRDQAARDFNENDANLITSIAGHVSNALYGKELSDTIKYQAHHDSLTQLPNRRYFEDQLQGEIDSASTCSSTGAVMFLDLDGFKVVNDTLGHAIGDKLLFQVANRLKRRLPEGDLLARIGGDEFAVILREISEQQQAVDIASRLSESLRATFEVSGTNLKIGVSTGISFYPIDGNNADELLRHADEAMYRAKAVLKGSIVCFNQNMADESRKRTRLEYELRDAIEQQQFLLHYQPQVNTQTGQVECMEALIRWNHQERGFIPPGEFIPVAEEAGFINPIGFWVLNEAIVQLAKWQHTPLSSVRVSINIAASQFLLENFTDQVLSKLIQHNVPPERLEIEVTESLVMRDIESVIARLNVLRAAGVRVAVDDFGTGYSSLSCLQDLPLDVLKIDRTFIVRLQDETTGNSLVNTIMLLARGLGLETVAEGVETIEQFKQVARLGCNFIQGFYFAKPCAASEVPEIIQQIETIYSNTITDKAA